MSSFLTDGSSSNSIPPMRWFAPPPPPPLFSSPRKSLQKTRFEEKEKGIFNGLKREKENANLCPFSLRETKSQKLKEFPCQIVKKFQGKQARYLNLQTRFSRAFSEPQPPSQNEAGGGILLPPLPPFQWPHHPILFFLLRLTDPSFPSISFQSPFPLPPPNRSLPFHHAPEMRRDSPAFD